MASHLVLVGDGNAVSWARKESFFQQFIAISKVSWEILVRTVTNCAGNNEPMESSFNKAPNILKKKPSFG